jgi:hypothetical protein
VSGLLRENHYERWKFEATAKTLAKRCLQICTEEIVKYNLRKSLEAFLPIHMRHIPRPTYFLIFLWLVLGACNAPDQNGLVTDAPENGSVPAASATAPDSSTPSPIAIMIASLDSDANLAAEVEEVLTEFGESNGLLVERRERLAGTDLPDGLRIVVGLSPDPGIVELAASAPQVQFVAIGIPGVQPGGNLTVIESTVGKPEHLGFIAGYTAAIITEDWRVAVISVSDTEEGQLFRESFLTGVRYYCGLCRQTYPPYYNYPLSEELPAGASAEQWRSSADQLLSSAVMTVYVAPGAGDNSLLEYIAQSGAVIIGSVPPPEELGANWVATIQVDFRAALRSALAEQKGESVETRPEFLFVNPERLSIGRLAHIKAILDDLAAGYILPVEP